VFAGQVNCPSDDSESEDSIPYDVVWVETEYIINFPEGITDPLEAVNQYYESALVFNALVDPDMYYEHLVKFRDCPTTFDQSIISDLYSPELSSDMAVFAAEPFNSDNFLSASRGLSAAELHRNLGKIVKDMRNQRSVPQPIPEKDLQGIKTINDLRRYITENSHRDRIWSQAGRHVVPEGLLQKPYTEVCQWVRQWRDKVWSDNLLTRGIELVKCPDCGLHVRKDDHKCFVVKSKAVMYKGGLPYNKSTQVTTQGDKIVTRTKKQLDLVTAIKNYQKVRDVTPNAPALVPVDFKTEVNVKAVPSTRPIPVPPTQTQDHPMNLNNHQQQQRPPVQNQGRNNVRKPPVVPTVATTPTNPYESMTVNPGPSQISPLYKVEDFQTITSNITSSLTEASTSQSSSTGSKN